MCSKGFFSLALKNKCHERTPDTWSTLPHPLTAPPSQASVPGTLLKPHRGLVISVLINWAVVPWAPRGPSPGRPGNPALLHLFLPQDASRFSPGPDNWQSADTCPWSSLPGSWVSSCLAGGPLGFLSVPGVQCGHPDLPLGLPSAWAPSSETW